MTMGESVDCPVWFLMALEDFQLLHFSRLQLRERSETRQQLQDDVFRGVALCLARTLLSGDMAERCHLCSSKPPSPSWRSQRSCWGAALCPALLGCWALQFMTYVPEDRRDESSTSSFPAASFAPEHRLYRPIFRDLSPGRGESSSSERARPLIFKRKSPGSWSMFMKLYGLT